MSIISKVLTTVFGRKSDKDLKKILPTVEKINLEYESLNKLSENDLKLKFQKIKDDLQQLILKNKNKYLEENKDLNTVDDLLYKDETQYLDDHMVEVFAIVKDASRRLCGSSYQVMGQKMNWDMVHYDVQLIGGIVLHQGNIAEMKTGEGKTLVSTLAIALNAITGRGLHVVTVNDYLAQRDSEWMGFLFKYLGLSVGCILDRMSPLERKEMYAKDITYGTNSQFGFDYLRDNMAVSSESQVQRNHVYAIVDEVDSVLIDEARTPLIISGVVNSQQNEQYTVWKPSVESLIKKQNQNINEILSDIENLIESDKNAAGRKLLLASRGAPKNNKLKKTFQIQGTKQLCMKVESELIRDKKLNELDEELYFSIDEKSNIVDLSEKGREFLSPDDPESFVIPDIGEEFHKIEKKLSKDKDIAVEKEKLQALHSERSEKIHTINQLLKAFSLFELDNEYIVQDGKVLIVDQHTGRVMHGRQFSDGMHQAIEAKEKVAIQRETQTVATITIQNYFRMYEKLSGMTGTAKTEAPEFMQIYKLDVVEIPTNKPISRTDHEDLIYKTNNEKYSSVISRIKELYDKGQPVLVGTTSVEESELLSKLIKKTGLPHNVLNAKQHQSEADIITRAGLNNAITISTNMAGRGTDIKLGDGVKEAGGLFILGTGRHESRRIDLQLRGRAGRQGDAGESVFYLSLEDNLMRLFGSDRIAKVMDRMGIKEGEVITHSMVTKSIERAQKKVEAMNYSGRKNIIEYDDVMNYQREIVYNRRNYSLHKEDISEELNVIINEYVDDVINIFCQGSYNDWDFESLNSELLNTFGIEFNFDQAHTDTNDINQITKEQVKLTKEFKNENFNEELFNNFQKFIILRTIDEKWQDHLYAMDQLREGIGLRAYGQKNPLIEYKQEGFKMFEQMMEETNQETLKRIFRTDLTSVKSSSMALNERAKNLKMKNDQSSQANSNAQKINPANIPNQTSGMMPPTQNFQSKVLNKRTPIKVDKKVGRNEPCPCGSGKKYKKCHG
ncbi:MAG: preprotein translocase subunit SecA [Candidatus Marinimicrobia bacterium]|nr:preprotein translocase subunit SecA [Candidatus Neomarinimicrobiota bacterium]